MRFRVCASCWGMRYTCLICVGVVNSQFICPFAYLVNCKFTPDCELIALEARRWVMLCDLLCVCGNVSDCVYCKSAFFCLLSCCTFCALHTVGIPCEIRCRHWILHPFRDFFRLLSTLRKTASIHSQHLVGQPLWMNILVGFVWRSVLCYIC